MKKLKLSQEWLIKLLPEGLPYPSSTLISGPGGSGKPLIGFSFIYDWLKAGGNVVFIALQYAETKFVKTSLRQLYNMDVDSYAGKVAYIQFGHNIETWEKINQNTLRANLLKPDIWEKAADNLMFARMEEKMKLYLSIDKINNEKVEPEEIQVPVKREILEQIKEVAECTRKREIPEIRKI